MLQKSLAIKSVLFCIPAVIPEESPKCSIIKNLFFLKLWTQTNFVFSPLFLKTIPECLFDICNFPDSSWYPVASDDTSSKPLLSIYKEQIKI